MSGSEQEADKEEETHKEEEQADTGACDAEAEAVPEPGEGAIAEKTIAESGLDSASPIPEGPKVDVVDAASAPIVSAALQEEIRAEQVQFALSALIGIDNIDPEVLQILREVSQSTNMTDWSGFIVYVNQKWASNFALVPEGFMPETVLKKMWLGDHVVELVNEYPSHARVGGENVFVWEPEINPEDLPDEETREEAGKLFRQVQSKHVEEFSALIEGIVDSQLSALKPSAREAAGDNARRLCLLDKFYPTLKSFLEEAASLSSAQNQGNKQEKPSEFPPGEIKDEAKRKEACALLTKTSPSEMNKLARDADSAWETEFAQWRVFCYAQHKM